MNPTVPLLGDIKDNPSNRKENISAENTPEFEILASNQHTRNEEDCLHMGHQEKPLNIIHGRHSRVVISIDIFWRATSI